MSDWEKIAQEFRSSHRDDKNQFQLMAEEIVRLRDINEQQAKVIRDHKWDDLIESLAASEVRKTQLQKILKSAVDDIRQLDGTCPHETWIEMRDALAVTDPPALLVVLKNLDAVGPWMSAALDDPKVCAEMKADANRYLEALTSLRAALGESK